MDSVWKIIDHFAKESPLTDFASLLNTNCCQRLWADSPCRSFSRVILYTNCIVVPADSYRAIHMGKMLELTIQPSDLVYERQTPVSYRDSSSIRIARGGFSIFACTMAHDYCNCVPVINRIFCSVYNYYARMIHTSEET